MKRAPIVLGGTALGLAATLGFHAHRPVSAVAVTATPSSPSGTSASPSAKPSTSSSTSSSSATKAVTSDAVPTQYGPVQLKVTISGGKITDITPLQLPANDPKSAQIGSYAEPLLRQSALSKQSASVDVVSGATFTSNGYQTALQSALDKAGFPASTSSSAGTA
jgi:uncharacterized protein with FMN-binding domain